MKKLGIIFSFMLLFSFNSVLKAECNDEELNEWATKAEVKFNLKTDFKENINYAYVLSITPTREDITLKVIDGVGYTAEGKVIEGTGGLYGVGCYLNQEEETYTLEIYGAKNSKCPNEKLKTLEYTVPRYNEMRKMDMCEEYPEHELCQPFTNATKDMSEDDFKKTMEKYDEKISSKTLSSNKILSIIKEYSLYIIIPFVLIAAIYLVRIRKYKNEERNK